MNIIKEKTLPNGFIKILNLVFGERNNHEYKRHGTVNLFAVLEISTGLVKTNQFLRIC
jgi:hypothetical protein